VSNTYTWSSSGTAADGTLFTVFLATLNGGDYYSPSAGQDVSGWVSTAPPGTYTAGSAGTCFANHCDWRIPTIAELNTIIESTAPGCGGGSPCIDPAFGLTQASYYWSSSSLAGNTGSAWLVYTPSPALPVNQSTKNFVTYARAVRSGR